MAAAAKRELSGQYIGKFQCKIGYGKVHQTSRVWVGGLGDWCKKDMLEREFDRFGAMGNIDYEIGDTEALIQYESIDAAAAAVNEMRGFALGGNGKRIKIDFADDPNYEPPKGYQGHVIKAQVHHHAHDENDSIHDCDTDSCISSEKCYCSLRKDPRSTATTTPKLRPKLAPIPSDSDSCCGNHFTTSEMSDSATDTTCYSVRHVPIVKHNHSSAHMSLSGAETPQTAWRRNSKSISNDISSDTYSDAGIMLNSSASSSGSCKMCEVHHKMHHHTSDDDHSNLSRKNSGNSGGSGYQSNDSTCCSHHCGGSHSGSGSPHSRPITSASSIACSQCPPSSCSSCQTSLAGSLMSTRRSRPKLSLPYSHSNINLSAAGLGSPMDMERSSRGRSSSPQKMLVVSAMDRSGKVRNNQNTREPPLVRKLSLSARKVQELSAGRELEEDCKICERQYKMRV